MDREIKNRLRELSKSNDDILCAFAEIDRMHRESDRRLAMYKDAKRDAKRRIAELEAELNQCLDCCKRVGELESEVERLRVLDNPCAEIRMQEAARDDGFKAGMEQAIKIAETVESEPFVEPRETIVQAIRKEIE